MKRRFHRHREQVLQDFLKKKKDYFEQNPLLLGIGRMESPDRKRIRFDIPTNFKYISYEKGLELNLGGFIHSKPAYVRAKETISLSDEKLIEYQYIFQWHGAKYTCHGESKDKQEKYTLRFEIHDRPDSEPHVHVIHSFPKIKGKRINCFEDFFEWVIINFYDETGRFISKYPWER